MKAIIIDDESYARKLLMNLLKEYCPEVEILGDSEDLPNGVKQIRKLKPDIVFIDIEMPGHSGLELLDFFNEEEVDFNIVFTTAYNKYAIQAFKLSAVEYLLKPLESEDVMAAVQKCIKSNQNKFPQYQVLKNNLKGDQNLKIAVPVGNGFKVIDLNSIVYLKADNTYTEMHFQDKKTLIISRTLKNFEDTIVEGSPLIRTHKSYIVNKNFITDVIKSDGGYLLLNETIEIPITLEKSKEIINEFLMIKRG